MKTRSVQSYKELEELTSLSDKAFLLLYKEGSEQSDCALDRIEGLEGEEDIPVYTANVSKVRDIHEKLGVDTAPSLVVFRKNRVSNIVKGCQTSSSYDSILNGKGIGGMVGEGDKQKQVTVYTTPTCSWCTTLKTYLDGRKVRYREINVASDTTAAESMVRKSGQQGVPQTEINGQMIVGFDKTRINQLLGLE